MKYAGHSKAHRTVWVPVTTMEDLLILSDDERAEMVASLKAAEARIASGEYIEHNPGAFVDRLMDIRASAITKKKA